MNQHRREPTDENLEKYRRTEGGKTYWHTSDFLLYDEALEEELDELLHFVMDGLLDESAGDSDRQERVQMFRVGRRVIQTARRLGMDPGDLAIQLDHFGEVIWLPICIWKKGEDGSMSRSLMSSLQGLNEQS